MQTANAALADRADLMHGKIVSQPRIRCPSEYRAVCNRVLLSLALVLNGTLTASGQANDIARLYTEAQKAQAAGDFAGAIRNYQSILRLRPQMAEAWANLGNLYYQESETDRAREAYMRAIRLKPDLPGPYFFLGVISFRAHEYTDALKYLQQAAASQGPNAAISSYLGYTRYARGEFKEAGRALEKAWDLEPTDIDVLYHLSKSYGHLAAEHFSVLEKSFPDSVYAVLARAHLAETKEEWSAARQHYALALDKLPDNKRIREKLQSLDAKASGSSAPPSSPPDELIDASLMYRDSPPSGPALKKAIAAWRSRVASAGTPETQDKSEYFVAEGYQVLSYLCLLAVLEADPDSYRAHQLRAQMMEESRNDEGAIREYREVLQRKPDLQNIHFAIGSLYWKDQRFKEARPELMQELKLNPSHPEALYELGDILAFEGDGAAAEKYFVAAVKLDPGMAEAHFALEKIYTQAGRYQESLTQLQQVARLDPADPTPHYRRALVYRKLGKTQEAESELAIFNRKKAALNAVKK